MISRLAKYRSALIVSTRAFNFRTRKRNYDTPELTTHSCLQRIRDIEDLFIIITGAYLQYVAFYRRPTCGKSDNEC